MVQKPEIVEGIKNAVERGSSFEKAKQSFINAGYNLDDVEDSARALTGSGPFTPSSQNYSSPPNQSSSQTPFPRNPKINNIPIPNSPQVPHIKSEVLQKIPVKSSKKIVWIVLLILILVTLLGVLGASIFFKEKLLELLSKIGINF